MTGDHIRSEVEDEARRLFPGSVRRIEWLAYGDAPMIEPGEMMPRFVLAGPRGRRRPKPREALTAFQRAHGPALRQFRQDLTRRWPEIRHVGVTFEDKRGRGRGGIVRDLDDGGPDGGDFIPLRVRLGAAELETVDTLITAGIASSRAEAIRWALARIRARPAYARLREGTGDARDLESGF